MLSLVASGNATLAGQLMGTTILKENFACFATHHVTVAQTMESLEITEDAYSAIPSSNTKIFSLANVSPPAQLVPLIKVIGNAADATVPA